jgi:hypothetical protein
MNSKFLMTASAVVMGFLGISASFFPKEILTMAELSPNIILNLFIQIIGALYVGFAVMNWMAKTVLIGGIYARPLAMGNFAHFMIAAIALAKAVINNTVPQYLWILAVIYLIFAVWFAIVLFTHPDKK